jgi:DNA-binding transcriptional MerR regulator
MGVMEPRGAAARDADDGLISIGRFARLSGLSIGALRHYDELDLLRPADVDRFTGYRRYRPEQLEVARTIGRLRDLEVPIEEIRQVLGADDPGDQRRRIGAHERRLQARVDRLVHLLHVTRQLSQGKEPLMTATGTTATETLDAETHRQLGRELYNHTWSLIEATDRTPEQDDEMLLGTHASAYHWSKSGGTLANAARSQWQIARVYSTLGRGEPAVWHAKRCLELAEAAVKAGVADDWDVPAALEGLARAQAVAGDRATAEATRARAREAVRTIADPEDRQLIEQDLETTPL